MLIFSCVSGLNSSDTLRSPTRADVRNSQSGPKWRGCVGESARPPCRPDSPHPPHFNQTPHLTSSLSLTPLPSPPNPLVAAHYDLQEKEDVGGGHTEMNDVGPRWVPLCRVAASPQWCSWNSNICELHKKANIKPKNNKEKGHFNQYI